MSKAAELAALIANVNKGSSLASKNLIINGGMDVAQRSTSEASKTTVDGYVCLDRWSIQTGSVGTFTHSQSSDVPAGYGFSNSVKFDCTTADASPDYGLIRQRFEGQNLQVLNKGTSSAVPVTLSFWVKSNLTGNFQVNLQDIDTSGSRHIGATYSISSADTWEKKEITFAGDTTGALDNDNACSFNIEWWLAAGSTYNSGSVPTSWAAEANANRAAGLNVSIGSSTDNDFFLTGVQLEIGEKATAFEHEPYAVTLSKCHRYCSIISSYGAGNVTANRIYSLRYAGGTSSLSNDGSFIQLSYPQKRTEAPTVSYTAVNGTVSHTYGLSSTHIGLYDSDDIDFFIHDILVTDEL
tara:strand:+ start:836 stop:1894 length:1059 start_codon:yes stop_codon:yes gene_type:complete